MLVLVSCTDNEELSGGGGDTPATSEAVAQTSETVSEDNFQNGSSSTNGATNKGGEVELPRVEF